MTITLNADYDVTLNTALLGYVGETNARPVSVEGLTVDGADRYVMTIDYGDGVQYEVDITGGQWTPTADILRSAQTVSCQIAAKKLAGNEYILVKKSRIFRLRIGAAIGDNAVPSPSVAADALDRIDAIGRQTHADMQTAVTAAETATTAAENAKKSATAAEKSADTATQAAERAETAQAAAETSATQAETAKQGAETARAEAVKSQNDAKVSAAQASTAAQQTEADKTITSGYAKTAKTNADSTAADRQAVQTLATQVTADKATVADHAAQVTTDRKAAETAAQTAQSIADSLPDDYVTAVGKIAEIANLKLTDKELTRRVNALYDIGQGVTHKFETDTDTAYAKTVPTGAKLMSVKSIGGHSEVIDGEIVSAETESVVEQGKNLLNADDYYVSYKQSDGSYVNNFMGFASINIPVGKYIGKTLVATLKATVPPELTSFFWVARIDGARIESSYAKGERVLANTTGIAKLTFTPKTQKDTLSMTYGQGTGDVIVRDIQIELGDTPTTYAPFHRNVYQIPEVIKALPGYGWSAGTARNYVDYENKRYVQCVNSVDLGTLTWTAGGGISSRTVFIASSRKICGQKLSYNSAIASNILCSKYLAKSQNEVWSDAAPVGIATNATIDGYVYVNDTAYTDATAFKQAMQGVMLYYELETPIVTDISSLIPDDFLRNIEVEAKGSVTFKNSNGDDYRIPVPSEEEYIVKLSEVGGTT
ncbi:MAG: hypothetical protein ACLTQM_10560 [Ruminococcus bicirculans (ex Wegman et al. 2014)]|jgi:hypothetical protein|uniref:hypothetical protein n=1 Tax=Ruminococcus bicirculans (ex Wegman et al. 2014) TaxID=1160721 RepID=UPI003993A9E6